MAGLVTYPFQVLIAAVLAFVSSYFAWWMPLVVYPLLLRTFIVLKGFHDPVFYEDYHCLYRFADPARNTLQSIISLQMVAWMLTSIGLCCQATNPVWGIPTGVLIGVIAIATTLPHGWIIRKA